MTSDELGSLLDELGIDRLRYANQNWYGCCPIHGERRPSWGMHESEPHRFGCFACGASGTLITLLRDHYGWTVEQIEDRIGGSFSLDYAGKMKTDLGESSMLKTVDDVRLFPYVLTERAIQYAKKRGLKDSTIKAARLLYDHKQNRLIFPWYIGNRFVGATGRAMRDAPNVPKIIAYFGLNKAEAPYIPDGTIRREGLLILVEGEIDALKVYQAGFRNVMALAFGRKSKTHVSFIRSLTPSKIVLFFDKDRTGRSITESYEREFENMNVFSVRYSRLSADGKIDPGELSEQMIRYLIRDSLKHTGIWSNFSLD